MIAALARPLGRCSPGSALFEVGDQFLGRQRGKSAASAAIWRSKQPFLLGQQLGRVFVLVVQRGVKGVEFFVESIKVFIGHLLLDEMT